jgi:hypothetical protein
MRRRSPRSAIVAGDADLRWVHSIQGHGTSHIVVQGVPATRAAARHRVVADRIEAGTFLCAVAADRRRRRARPWPCRPPRGPGRKAAGRRRYRSTPCRAASGSASSGRLAGTEFPHHRVPWVSRPTCRPSSWRSTASSRGHRHGDGDHLREPLHARQRTGAPGRDTSRSMAGARSCRACRETVGGHHHGDRPAGLGQPGDRRAGGRGRRPWSTASTIWTAATTSMEAKLRATGRGRRARIGVAGRAHDHAGVVQGAHLRRGRAPAAGGRHRRARRPGGVPQADPRHQPPGRARARRACHRCAHLRAVWRRRPGHHRPATPCSRHGSDGLYQPLDLQIAKCRISVAVREGFDYASRACARVRAPDRGHQVHGHSARILSPPKACTPTWSSCTAAWNSRR